MAAAPPSAGGQVWPWVRAGPWRPRERICGAGRGHCRHPLGAVHVKNGAGCRAVRLLPFDGRAFLQLKRYSRTCRAFFLFFFVLFFFFLSSFFFSCLSPLMEGAWSCNRWPAAFVCARLSFCQVPISGCCVCEQHFPSASACRGPVGDIHGCNGVTLHAA